LFDQAREAASAGAPGLCQCAVDEGIVRSILAEQGVEVRTNLEQAVALFERARKSPNHGDLPFGLCLMSEASARCMLADNDVDPLHNLDVAEGLFQEARKEFRSNPVELARCMCNEANLWKIRAKGDGDPRASMRRALSLLEQASHGLVAGTAEHELCQRSASSTRELLERLEAGSPDAARQGGSPALAAGCVSLVGLSALSLSFLVGRYLRVGGMTLVYAVIIVNIIYYVFLRPLAFRGPNMGNADMKDLKVEKVIINSARAFKPTGRFFLLTLVVAVCVYLGTRF
jgi:hypothetical protein